MSVLAAPLQLQRTLQQGHLESQDPLEETTNHHGRLYSTALYNTNKGKKMKRGQGPSTARIHVKLLEDVAGQGFKGDVLQVRPSFFANYLHPTKKAIRLTDSQLEAANKMLVHKDEHFQAQVQKWADFISTLELVFEREAHENGMIPQDMEISKNDLASSLVATIGQLAAEQPGLDLKVLSRLGKVSISQVYNRRNVMMRMNPRGIRYLGPYRATVGLHHSVAAEFKIEVKRPGT